ncbi:hypothetical protein AOQ84DRAFT_276521, partial [Glonium stellatum]
IVAIHGLGGHMYDTWTDKKTKVLWLRDFLPQSDELKNARIYTFGYDAKIVGSRSIATLRHIAQSLNSSLIHEENDKPLIFICHSLGGIIAKIAITLSKNNREFQKLYHHIHGIMFFGTPHQGSDGANLGT